MSTSRNFAVAASFLLAFSCPVHTEELFNGPECVAFDEARNRYLVSNWTDGRIISLDTNGVQAVFKAGFAHAYGNCITEGTFYFSAGKAVVGLDLVTAEVVLNLPISGSQQMDGMACDDEGNLYVLETLTPKIFKIHLPTRAITTFVATGLPPYPQDLVYDRSSNRLVVCAYRDASPVMAVGLSDSSVITLAVPGMGNFDGIAQDQNGYFYLSSWATNSVHRFDHDFLLPPVTVSSGHSGPSNLCYNARDNLLAVPSFNSNRVDLVQLAPTGISEMSVELSRAFRLHQNYPNPFNPTTSIEYTLTHAGNATLSVCNVLGENLATLVNAYHAAGNFEVRWDASGMPSGVYFYRLTAGEYVQTRKMVLMR